MSLQSTVSSRLGDTQDSQVVEASYQNDVASAGEITTDPESTPMCAPAGTVQLLGLLSNLNTSTTGAEAGEWETDITYASVQLTSTTWALERYECTNYSAYTPNPTPSSVMTLSYNVPQSQAVPTINCVSSATSSECSQTQAASEYVQTEYVSNVTFPVVESSGKDTDSYTLVAAPVDSTSATNVGSPFTTATTTSCEFATPNTGTYASSLCFVNFSNLTGAALAEASGGGCLEMSVSLRDNYIMYFCIGISGALVEPWYLPTYPEAYLGNVEGGIPFYSGLSGDPALYQRVEGATDTITFSNISVVSPTGSLASGWELVSADAESTDVNESLTWTSNVDLSYINNGQSVDSPTDPVGNACEGNTGVGGAGLTGNGTTQMECSGGTGETSANKTGAAMIEAPDPLVTPWVAPTTMTVTLVGNGLQGITFGLLVS
jgi:hypothetical protein